MVIELPLRTPELVCSLPSPVEAFCSFLDRLLVLCNRHDLLAWQKQPDQECPSTYSCENSYRHYNKITDRKFEQLLPLMTIQSTHRTDNKLAIQRRVALIRTHFFPLIFILRITALLQLTLSDRRSYISTLKLSSSTIIVIVPRHQVKLLLSLARFL